MNSTPSPDKIQALQESKARILLTGVGLGALLGLISSYLYTRAAEDNSDGEAGPGASITTGQVLALLLSMLGLVRQIAELGKPNDDKKSGKK